MSKGKAKRVIGFSLEQTHNREVHGPPGPAIFYNGVPVPIIALLLIFYFSS